MKLLLHETPALALQGLFGQRLLEEATRWTIAQSPIPVSLEAPFTPFSAKDLFAPPEPHLSTISNTAATAASRLEEHLEVRFSLGFERPAEGLTAVLIHLLSLRHPLCIELIGDGQRVRVQLSTSSEDRELVRLAYRRIPGVFVADGNDELPARDYHLTELVAPPPYWQVVDAVSSTSLSDSFLAGLAPVVGTAVLQVLLSPVRGEWGKNITNCLDAQERLRELNLPESLRFPTASATQMKLSRKKAGSPLFAVAVRMACTNRRHLQLLASGLGNFRCGDQPLQLLRGNGSPPPKRQLLERQTFRHGLLLSLEEVLLLLSLPTAEQVRQYGLRDRPPAPERGILLGYDGEQPVVLADRDRLRHALFVGASGMGKSTSLARAVLRDINAGVGGALIDPHGDTVEAVMDHLHADHADRVIYLDPTDPEYVLAYNPFAMKTDQPGARAEDFVYLFREVIASSFGPRMASIIRNAAYALYHLPDACLADMRLLLSSRGGGLRSQLLGLLKNEEARLFWQEEFPSYTKTALDAVNNKLSALLIAEALGRLFRNREHRLDLSRIMSEGQFVLLTLPSAKLSADGAGLVGGLFVGSLFATAVARERGNRRPFALFVDEFQRFVSAGAVLEDMLRESRKYGLSLNFATQTIGSLPEELLIALSNVDNVVAFALDVDDAKRMTKRFPGLRTEDLVQQHVGQAWARLGREVYQLRTLPPLQERTTARREVIDRSRERYYLPWKPEDRRERRTTEQEPLYDEI